MDLREMLKNEIFHTWNNEQITFKSVEFWAEKKCACIGFEVCIEGGKSSVGIDVLSVEPFGLCFGMRTGKQVAHKSYQELLGIHPNHEKIKIGLRLVEKVKELLEEKLKEEEAYRVLVVTGCFPFTKTDALQKYEEQRGDEKK